MRLNDFQISPNLNLREFQCPCCHAVIVHRKLVSLLQRLREMQGGPLVVTSGYRCAPHNAAVGGVANSLHRRGLAAAQRAFCEMAKEAGFAKALAYPERSFVHLEVLQ